MNRRTLRQLIPVFAIFILLAGCQWNPARFTDNGDNTNFEDFYAKYPTGPKPPFTTNTVDNDSLIFQLKKPLGGADFYTYFYELISATDPEHIFVGIGESETVEFKITNLSDFEPGDTLRWHATATKGGDVITTREHTVILVSQGPAPEPIKKFRLVKNSTTSTNALWKWDGFGSVGVKMTHTYRGQFYDWGWTGTLKGSNHKSLGDSGFPGETYELFLRRTNGYGDYSPVVHESVTLPTSNSTTSTPVDRETLQQIAIQIMNTE